MLVVRVFQVLDRVMQVPASLGLQRCLLKSRSTTQVLGCAWSCQGRHSVGGGP